MPSKAAHALRKKFFCQADVARELDVTPQAVSEWMAGRAKPSSERMRHIEDLWGIPMRDWLEPDRSKKR